MKTICILIVLTLIATTLAESLKDKLNGYSKTCESEPGISDKFLNKIQKKEKIVESKLKKHAFCVLKKFQFMTNNGDFMIETITTEFLKTHGKQVIKVIDRCAEKKNSPEETAAHFFHCVDSPQGLTTESELCKTESGVSQQTLDKVSQKKDVNDAKLKKYAFCLMKKTGCINDNGDFSIESIKTQFLEIEDDNEKVEQIINKCAKKKTTPEETALQFYICVQ